MDFSQLVPWICASLNCTTPDQLDPWTLNELYTYAEEKLRSASRRWLLILKYDATTALAAGQGFYDLPDDHVGSIFAAVNGVVIRATTVAQLEAFDDDWLDAANGTPLRWTENALGLIMIRLYPPPAAAGALALVYQAASQDLNTASPVATAPAIMGDYLSLRVLEQARLRQGDAQMLDASKAFGSMAGVLEQAFSAYYGEGE